MLRQHRGHYLTEESATYKGNGINTAKNIEEVEHQPRKVNVKMQRRAALQRYNRVVEQWQHADVLCKLHYAKRGKITVGHQRQVAIGDNPVGGLQAIVKDLPYQPFVQLV